MTDAVLKQHLAAILAADFEDPSAETALR